MLGKKILVPSLSGFLYGYTTSIIAAAIIFIQLSFHLSAIDIGMVTSVLLLGAACSAFFGGKLANVIGRKYTLLLGTILFVVSGFVTSLTESYDLLLIGRFILGIACGLALTVAPIYLMEVSSARERGKNATFNQIGIALGSVVAYVGGYVLSFSHNWRLMFGVALIPAFVQLIGIFFIQDSHQFSGSSSRGSWKELFAKPYRARLCVGMGLIALQSLIGTPVIFYFAPYLFEGRADRDPSETLLITLFIGVIYLIGMLVCFFKIEKWGRRRLLLLSLLGTFVFLMAVVICYWLHVPFIYAVTFSSILLCILFYSIGIGPVPPLVIMEITPVDIRSYALTFATLIGMICTYVVTLTGPVLIENIAVSGTFCVYAFFALLGFLIFLKKLPETKQKSVTQLEKLF